MAELEQCSFCGKPRRSVLHLFIGPGGHNVCDACVAVASDKIGRISIRGNCSFCGRPSRTAEIVYAEKKASICKDCLKNCRDQMMDFTSAEPELLSSSLLGGPGSSAAELMSMVRDFARHSYKLSAAFKSGNIDWAAHNDMEQLLQPMRSKAGRLGSEEITEIILKIEQLFSEIQSDDVVSNAPSINKIADIVDHLLTTSKKITGA